jgi:hypothetical protein
MSINLSLPVCPTDCTDSLATVSFPECGSELHYGEIAKLYVANADAADFSNSAIITEWTTRLSDTSTDPDAIRTLNGMGELAAPEQTETLIPGGKYAYSPKTFTFTFNVYDTNDVNYNFMLSLYCNQEKKIWFEMADGQLYGGNEGIVLVLKGSQPLVPGREDIVKIILTGKWKSASDPLRTLSPMF